MKHPDQVKADLLSAEALSADEITQNYRERGGHLRGARPALAQAYAEAADALEHLASELRVFAREFEESAKAYMR